MIIDVRMCGCGDVEICGLGDEVILRRRRKGDVFAYGLCGNAKRRIL